MDGADEPNDDRRKPGEQPESRLADAQAAATYLVDLMADYFSPN